MAWPCRRLSGCPLLQIWKLQPWLAEQAEALLKELVELPEPHIGMHIRSPGKTAVQARTGSPHAFCQVKVVSPDALSCCRPGSVTCRIASPLHVYNEVLRSKSIIQAQHVFRHAVLYLVACGSG